jgi:hypothetical protein
MNRTPHRHATGPDRRPANPDRRMLIGRAGISGTAVLLTTASRSALGGWGQCTGSELASGNLSRVGSLNPCGCSPGYWWNPNGFDTWDRYIEDYPRATSRFNVVFGVNAPGNLYFSPDVNLSACGPSSDNPRAFLPVDNSLSNVAMHAVAALFNATFYGNRYPVPGLQTPGAVVSAFQTAFGQPDTQRAARLRAFVVRVDVYQSSNTWCNGSEHGGST